uniref:Uncharacterized protein TCIL3000_11_650 n=1 Tax=Trypanosoma congolense (strain IL3000) TaxID=1068625 RepID=G0UZ66_TRYCI|nr:unnamed protein product [Trypanosoma congolense IL3000]
MSLANTLFSAKEILRVKVSGNEYARLIHDATNEDPWGPTGEQMDKVCMAFLSGTVKIMEEIKLRLKNRDKSWRGCYKCLLLLDHLARNVPESGLPALCSVLSTVQLISQTFKYTGKNGTDHGLSVRERAKKLCDLLSDASALREERNKAAATRAKLSGAPVGPAGFGGFFQQGGQEFHDTAPPTSNVSSSFAGDIVMSRVQQERLDMELAVRIQREEEQRSGTSLSDARRLFRLEKEKNAAREASEKNDLELARRLEEEERRLASFGVDSLNLAPEAVPTSATTAGNTAGATQQKIEPPKSDVLDDLFSSAPAAPPSSIGAPTLQQAPLEDSFGAFMSTSPQPQQQQWPQQHQQWPQQQQQWPQQQQQQWPQQQQQQWPQQGQWASIPQGNSQPLAALVQQFSGTSSGGNWQAQPQQPSQMMGTGQGTTLPNTGTW